jgi:putative sigma-54 modulation protein
MKINITTRHTEQSAAHFEPVVQAEVEKLEKFNAGIVDAQVVIEQLDKEMQVEINANVPGLALSALAKEENFGKALDSALAKLTTQLKKHNEKLKSHHGAPAAEVAL